MTSLEAESFFIMSDSLTLSFKGTIHNFRQMLKDIEACMCQQRSIESPLGKKKKKKLYWSNLPDPKKAPTLSFFSWPHANWTTG